MNSHDRASRWPQIEALFDEAQMVPREQRAEWLARRAGGDAELRQEVQALLRHADAHGDVLDRPAPIGLLGGDPLERFRAACAAETAMDQPGTKVRQSR